MSYKLAKCISNELETIACVKISNYGFKSGEIYQFREIEGQHSQYPNLIALRLNDQSVCINAVVKKESAYVAIDANKFYSAFIDIEQRRKSIIDQILEKNF